MSFLDFGDTGVQSALVSAVVGAAVAIVVAIFNPVSQRRLNRQQAEFDRELEKLRSRLAGQETEADARIAYEFDARKRLYEEIEPLTFQLIDAAEESYARMVSLVRSQKLGGLGRGGGVNWLSHEGYYLTSTLYKLFLPHAVYMLMKQSSTFVDFRLDPGIRTRHKLMRIAGIAMTDHFDFAELEPELTYTPDADGWQNLRLKEPARYWQQALHIGQYERTIEAFLVMDGARRRTMTYGEFEREFGSNKDFRAQMSAAVDLIHGFNFSDRPVLARLLLAHAFVMHLVIISANESHEVPGLRRSLEAFRVSGKAAEDLVWDKACYDSVSVAVAGYLAERLSWIERSDHASVHL